MQIRKIIQNHPFFYSAFILVIFLSLLFRVILPIGNVFTDDGIVLNTPDAYYFTYCAELYSNTDQHQYYLNYPNGRDIDFNTFTWIVGFIADVFNVEPILIIAILPPILFILTLFCVFFICKAMFKNRYIALLAIFILSLLSGNIMHRTMLGAGDKHCLEVFLLTLIILCTIKAYQNLGKYKYYIFAVFGLIAMIAYWYVGSIAVIALFIIGIVVFIHLWFGNKIYWELKVGIVLLIGIALILSPLQESIIYYFNRSLIIFMPNLNTYISEEFPLIFTSGKFDLSVIWFYFGALFYLIPVGIGIFIYKYVKERKFTDLLFLVWSIILLIMAIAQRRWDYYFAVNVAIVASYTIFQLMYFIRKVKIRHVTLFRGFIILFILMSSIPLIRADINMGISRYGMMSSEWIETTKWLRQYSDEESYYNGDKPEFGVFTWNTYGYWIVQAGHMPVRGSPGNWLQSDLVANILISNDYENVKLLLHKLRMKYIIIDTDMINDKFNSIYKTASEKNVFLNDMFMIKLFCNGIDGFKEAYQSSNSSIKIFEFERWRDG